MNGKQSDGEKYTLSYGKLKKKYSGDTGEASEQTRQTNTGVMAEDKLNALLSLAGGLNTANEKLYTYYRDLYTDGASEAAANAYGLASSRTGGYGNTYASAAARNAYDKYMSGFYDKMRDINTQTYKNISDFADKAAKLGDYSYYETLGADMSSKKFDDDISRAEKAAENGDDSLLEAMGVNTSAKRYDEELNRAVLAAKNGDYSLLDALGIDTTVPRYEELLKYAAKMADYGDYSGLEALGIQTQTLKDEKKLERALALAKYGDFSLFGEISGNIKNMRSKIPAAVQKGAETAFQNGGYKALNAYLERQIGYGQIDAAEKQRIMTLLTA